MYRLPKMLKYPIFGFHVKLKLKHIFIDYLMANPQSNYINLIYESTQTFRYGEKNELQNLRI